ncbi:NucA/NucB deoxyribonuclease domain-containing protein [Streptomyces phaeofaciens]|uniref:NucA/NucB deoxyribonuclease domain-containing protein n=1 Tax=Streptomyces phaeofaciens TaxID=68254 RepID=UPI00368A596B
MPGTGKTGCVMPYIPEMVYAKHGEYPELAGHIEDAQTIDNLPGRRGTTRCLTRLTNKAKIDENRSTACPTRLPRPCGTECDEHPFASTRQGARTGGGSCSRRTRGLGGSPESGTTGVTLIVLKASAGVGGCLSVPGG